MEKISDFLVNFFSGVSIPLTLVVGASLVFLVFTVCLIFKIVTGKEQKGFSVYDYLCFAIIALSFSVVAIKGVTAAVGLYAPLFTLCVYFILKCLLKIPVRKKPKENPVLTGFIRELDKSIHSVKNVEKISCRTADDDDGAIFKGDPAEEKRGYRQDFDPTAKDTGAEKSSEESCEKKEIDFSHVKNIIERLKYYNLNTSEKKQIKDLLSDVREAECGNDTEEKKNSINEGLGGLLKIMSKYHV